MTSTGKITHYLVLTSLLFLAACSMKSPARTAHPQGKYAGDDAESVDGMSTYNGARPNISTADLDDIAPRARQTHNPLAQIQADEVWVIIKQPTHRNKHVSADSDMGSGQMVIRSSDNKEIPLPLKHTDVKAKILAYVATVNVKQQYHNPYNSKIEAVYMFPLPQNSAVSDFIMTIGDRKIRGIIREKEEAKRIYYRARREGHVAALMTQNRPNVFTQRVANIEPGKSVDVDLTYYNTLPYRDGEYTFAFPMVVGPRFNPPGTKAPIAATAHGKHKHGAQPYLKPGQDSGHRLSLSVDLEAGVTLEGLRSINHRISQKRLSGSRQRITLAHGKTIPNKDFVLKYRTAGSKTKTAFITHQDKTGKYFTMVLQPPAALQHVARAPTEFVFVLDCSGSMHGAPLRSAKSAAIAALRTLRPNDTFQIIRFSSNASRLGARPLAANPQNIQHGIRYINSLNSTGGTMMIEGIKAALDYPSSPHRQRLVSFMTDGYIGNEADILRAISQKRRSARLFSFGIGSSVNRFLLERMALMGHGAVAYVGANDQEAERAVAAFYSRVQHPALSNISVNFGTMAVEGMYPTQLPDLLVGRPIVITGRYGGTAPTHVTISGYLQSKRVAYQVPVNRGLRHAALPKVWARMKMADLVNRSFYERDIAGLAGQVKETALQHGLMSPFTAFVAVDSSRRTTGTSGTTVKQSVPTPDGVNYNNTVNE